MNKLIKNFLKSFAKSEINMSTQVQGTPTQIKPNDFFVGKKDNSGLEIKKIYSKSLIFTVYRTENSLKIDIDDDCKECETIMDRHNKLGKSLGRIYSLLPEKLSWSEPINRLIARAITINAQGLKDDAEEILKNAESRIVKLKLINGKIQYTLSGFFVTLLIFIAAQNIEISPHDMYAKIALCGALGGILSITIGYKTLEIDTDAGFLTNSLVGISRIVISVIASVFIYFAIKSGFIFSSITTNQDGDYFLYFMAMLSGFSEMFVPNIMNNLVESNKDAIEQK